LSGDECPELDGEHYLFWIRWQYEHGMTVDELIERLRKYNRGRYSTERLVKHIRDAIGDKVFE
jgi:guanylate kinase